MPIPSPPLLDTDDDALGERTEKLAVAFTQGWSPPKNGEMDLGRALIRVFATMAEHAVDRINRVPDRSFLAFLDRIGVTPAEARAARVPLTFSLVARGEAEPTVKGRTRVGAKALPGDTREVVFETERDLFTTRARLAAVFVRQPDGDRLSDHTAEAMSTGEAFFEAFDGGDAAPHKLYLAADDVLGLPAGTLVTFAFGVDDPARWAALHAAILPPLTKDLYYGYHAPLAPLVLWTYWDGTNWSALTREAAPTTSLAFKIPANMAAVSVNGRKARWIRAELRAWPLAGIPKLLSAQASAPQSQAAMPPTAAIASGRPVDLSLDFYPFGEQPRLNDLLVLACDPALSREGANVTVSVTLNSDTKSLNAADAPVLTWEISTGSGWKMLFETEPTASTTNDVLRTATFAVPAEAAPMTIGNTKAVWLRIRLSAGSFGTGLKIIYTNGTPQMSDDGYRPPIVKSITLSSTTTIMNKKPLCTTEDDFAAVDRAFPASAPFAPFIRSPDASPMLYLGFDRAFRARDTHLYFQVAPLDPVSAAKEASAAASGNVAWEYWSSQGEWKQLVCEDETRAFAASGLLGFVAPADLARRTSFAKDLFWLRARYELPAALASSPPASPRLGHLLTNTVWARDAITRTNEILGSADGSAGQSFRLVARPVLAEHRIEVREPATPDGDDAVSGEVDPLYPGHVWVRWDAVEDFYASGPRDRHYTLDHETGLVGFGDGRRGMAPPKGTRNVRASVYATGGGTDGNRPAGTVTQLKTTVPYVDAVTNHERATGGANADTADDVKTWGPSTLRHGHRAVTAQDFEDLALEASPTVARARVITPAFDAIKAAEDPTNATLDALAPGSLVVLLATNGPELPPAATTGLLRDVDAYLRARSSPTIALRLAGPTWIEVSVTKLDITASSPIGMEALRDRIERALHAFFHPITGNTESAGWAFGALPYESDVYRIVTAIPGVDRVGLLEWTLRSLDNKPAPPLDDPMRARVLIYPGPQTVQVHSSGGA